MLYQLPNVCIFMFFFLGHINLPGEESSHLLPEAYETDSQLSRRAAGDFTIQFVNFYLLFLLWCLLPFSLTLLFLTVPSEINLFCSAGLRERQMDTCPYRIEDGICSFHRFSANPSFSPTFQFQRNLITSLPELSRFCD